MFIDVHTHNPTSHTTAVHSLSKDFELCTLTGYYSLGLHPWFIDQHTLKQQFEDMKKYSGLPNVVAIGECGLDKVCTTGYNLQQECFAMQVQLANLVKKPLIIHCVRAYDDVHNLLRQQQCSVPVVFHGFNKSSDLASQLTGHGYYLSFGESLLKEYVQKVFAQVPLERVLLETDRSNLSIDKIYHAAALASGIDVNLLSLQILKNSRLFFGNNFFKK